MKVGAADTLVADKRREGRWYSSNAGLCVPVLLLELREETTYADFHREKKKRKPLAELSKN